MADTVPSPNMNMPVPVVGVDAGPDWANNVNACLSILDSHNHSPGQGVQITPSGININADLPMGNNNLTTARSVRFTSQGSPLATASDIGCIYESGVDLYYNDGVGNQVRITQSGAVTGATGTITGLPSGTASASFAAGTFTFQSATNTPASMAVGPLIIGSASVSPKTTTIASNVSQPANYALTLPLALPAVTSFLSVDNAGNMALVAPTGSGSVVLDTSPAFGGQPTGTITSASFTPTPTLFGGTAGVDYTVNTNTWRYSRIGSLVQVWGTFRFTLINNGPYIQTFTIPIATSSLTVVGGIGLLTVGGVNTTIQTYLNNSGTTLVQIGNQVQFYINGTGVPYNTSFSYSYTVV